MKISHYYPHSGGILGCHANVDFQHTNYLLNVTICEKLRCAHKLQTISDAFSHIASRFVKVAVAIKFVLNWLAGPQCTGRDRYKEINRQYRAAIRSDTVAYFESECRKAGPAKMWRVLKPLIGDSKGAHDIPRVTPNATKCILLSNRSDDSRQCTRTVAARDSTAA